MSAIDDVRKVVQDLVAPELRALATRVDDLEKKVDENERRAELRHQDTIKYVDQRFTQLDQRFNDLTRHIDQRFEDMTFLLRKAMEVRDLADRVAAIEDRLKQQSAH